jgi:hypothetical protein
MKATCRIPIATIQGLIGPGYYARILNGELIIQRCPRKAPSAAQAEARRVFVERYAQPKKKDEVDKSKEDLDDSS